MLDPLRPIWFATGLAALGLGIAGAFLPLLPTTPFLLLAAFAFARSSPRLYNWLVNHRHFGPMITNWRVHGAISRRAKIAAVCTMAAAVLLSWLTGFSVFIIGLQIAVMAGVALFILTRPDAPAG